MWVSAGEMGAPSPWPPGIPLPPTAPVPGDAHVGGHDPIQAARFVEEVVVALDLVDDAILLLWEVMGGGQAPVEREVSGPSSLFLSHSHSP